MFKCLGPCLKSHSEFRWNGIVSIKVHDEPATGLSCLQQWGKQKADSKANIQMRQYAIDLSIKHWKPLKGYG